MIAAFMILAGAGVRLSRPSAVGPLRSRGDATAGTTIEIIIAALGSLLILLSTLDLLGVSSKNLLLGGAAIGLLLTAAPSRRWPTSSPE